MFPNDAIYCFRDISRYKTLSPGWEHYDRKCTLSTPGHKRVQDSLKTLSNVGCVMFGVHILGSVYHNRIYTLPTPGPKGPTDKASYILGVVSFGV